MASIILMSSEVKYINKASLPIMVTTVLDDKQKLNCVKAENVK